MAAINLGGLRRGGVALYTREAAAVVAEVCRQVFDAEDNCPALDLNAIWIDADGSLTITANGSRAEDDRMPALAALLEAVIPPLGSDEPDYAVRASMRMLGPRARGRTGLAPLDAPEALGGELQQYVTGEPGAVLRHLWFRADRALHQYLPPSGHEQRLRADRVMLEDEPAAAAALMFPPPQGLEEESYEPIAQGHSPSRRAWVGDSSARRIASALLFVIGFATGAWLGSYFYATRLSLPLAREPVRSSPHSTGGARRPAVPPPSGAVNTHVQTPRSHGARAWAPAPLDTSSVSGPAFSPSFARDGRELVFHVGRDPVARVVTAELAPEGTAYSVTTLSESEGAARSYHPRLSPDGQFVAFDSDREGERAVFVARRDWSDITRVSGSGMAALPSWSPDTKWMAFVRGEPTRPHVWNLWLREIRTGALTRLTNYSFGQTWNASWFPDSTRICYSHETALVVLNLTTRTARSFSSPLRGRLVRTPAVSPDGRRVIFQVHKDGVWLLDLANGAMRRVLDDPSAEEFAWDPHGTRIAYHSRRDGSWRIWLMPAPSA
jgi:Tol biopolymer transport system component